MDRNSTALASFRACTVALRKESVDRNRAGLLLGGQGCQSLSARRAWIEIANTAATLDIIPVALRKESVDRNPKVGSIMRAVTVALRKESVDRNKGDLLKQSAEACRSPQGERG